MVFAVVAMLLLAVAALAVDLTNLYAQRAVAQSRADTAAFAAAQALPDACDAVDAARQSLLDTGGPRSADEPEPVVRVFATDPRDEDGDPRTPPPRPVTVASTRPDCSTAGASVQVSTPPRSVPFVFAGVFDLFQEGSGVSNAAVSADARVRLTEPDLLPLVLPQGCAGDVFVLTTGSGDEEPPVEPDPLPSPDASPDPAPPPPSCAATVPDAGLGVIDSPVRSGETDDARLLLNLRDGIDHAVEALVDADEGDPDVRCEIGAPPGAVPDTPLATGTPNCLDVRPLLDVSVVRSTLERRLAAEPTFSRCRTAPVDASAWQTVAACYLLDGKDRGDVLGAVGGPAATPVLDESMLADPRFFVVPELVLDGPDEVGGFVPVLRLKGAFAVGLDQDGTLPAFVFPLEALPRLVLDGDAERPRTLVLTSPVVGPPSGDDP